MKKKIVSLTLGIVAASVATAGYFSESRMPLTSQQRHNIEALAGEGPVIKTPCKEGKDLCRIKALDADLNEITLVLSGYEANEPETNEPDQ